ncbi:two-component regulator propeller domain-containing protein [Bacteroides sp.]
MKKLLFFIILSTVVFTITAQPLCQIKHFTVNNGLAQGVVTTILQDKKGFIWFSTWNGLDKFDGYTFKNYKAFPGDGCMLSNNRITFIAESQTGDIWCQTYDGHIFLFDTQEEKFIDILNPIEEETKHINIVEQTFVLPKGVVWIACDKGYNFRIEEGLCKQGKGITLYNSFNQTLKGDRIFNIYQDSEGDEWVLTDKGVSVIGSKKADSDFPFYFIKEINGKIFLASTSGKLAVYDIPTEKIRFTEIPYDLQIINGIHDLGNNELALSTDKGVVIFNINQKSFKQIDIRTATQPSNTVHSVYKDRKGELWIFSNTAGIVRFNPTTGEKQHLMTPPEELTHYGRPNRNLIFEDKADVLWLIPHKGNFCYYDRANKQLKPFYTDLSTPSSIFTPNIRFYYTDRQGNFWFAGVRGVEKMSFFQYSYKHTPIDYGTEIRAVWLDKQKRFWIASKRGFIRIYAPNGELQGYLNQQGTISKTQSTFADNIYCFMEDKDGFIWMGGKEKGLFRLEQKDETHFSIQQFTHQPENRYSLSNNSVYSICQDSHNRIWIGCFGGGINLLTKSPENKIRFIHSNNELKNFPASHFMKVRCITEVPGEVLVAGTTEGMLTFSSNFEQPEEIKFHQNIRNPGIASSLGSNDVINIYTDSRKTTYVSTFTGGVSKILSKNLLSENIEFKTYTIRDGLASDLVLSTIEDPQKNLWIVSENTLSRFNPQEETFENYGSNFLQQEFNFSEAAPALNAKQQLVFGSDKGIIEINSTNMKKSDYAPPIVFTGLKIQGSQSLTGVDNLQELTLTPTQRNITFQFAALDYVAPEEIQYAYRLEGLEKEWNDADNNRSASYINLPAGEYRLQVRSTNSDRVWVDNIRTLTVKVLPTFWETAWAWGLYVVLFILFTFTIVYILFYIYRLRHQVDIEQQLSNIKLRFFTDISHELRTPLTLIASPITEILENEPLSPKARGHLTLVHKNTERMLRLVNQILDFRKIQNKKMKLLVEESDVVALLRKVTDSFQLIAEEKHIDLKIDTDCEELYIWVDRDKFEKIFFNLLSNAFKYTPSGKAVTVRIATDTETVTISVIDEGIGIDPGKQKSLFQRFETLARYNILQPSSGIGLSLVRELVELHHGTIEVSSQPGNGSRFSVQFPTRRETFEQDPQAEFILADSCQPTISGSATSYSESEVTPPAINQTVDDKDALSILIVEDNAELRTFLCNILTDTYIVIEAANGQEGLERALQDMPDLIISDVMMPVMDGLDMVKNIKSNRNICHIPIILLSAKSSLDDRIAGLEQGIDDYITKPFSATYLKTRIISLLQQRQMLQEIYLANLAKGEKLPSQHELIPSQPQITPFDEQFMQQVMEYMEEQMDNSELTIDDFANKLLLSRTVFYRKLKSIVGLTPVDFIRDIRIKRAVQLIDSDRFNISQVAYMTGFNDPKYFSKCFKKQMGVTPTEYKDKQKQ